MTKKLPTRNELAALVPAIAERAGLSRRTVRAVLVTRPRKYLPLMSTLFRLHKATGLSFESMTEALPEVRRRLGLHRAWAARMTEGVRAH